MYWKILDGLTLSLDFPFLPRVSTRSHPWIVTEVILIPIISYVTKNKFNGVLMGAISGKYHFNSEN
jgi:hypothetical protein